MMMLMHAQTQTLFLTINEKVFPNVATLLCFMLSFFQYIHNKDYYYYYHTGAKNILD